MAVGGLVLGAIGLGLQVYGQSQQARAQKQEEALREQQMNLDAMRQRREVVKNAAMARATALANASSQGAQFGSGLQGGYGEIAGQAGQQMQAVNQNQEIGAGIFAANRRYYTASVFTDIGSGLYSLGGSMINNAGTYSKLGLGGQF